MNGRLFLATSGTAALASACIDGIRERSSSAIDILVNTCRGFEDHVSPFALLSLSGVLGIASDELSEG